MSLENVTARPPGFPESVSEWSLASDQRVCEFLKTISNEMISEVTQVSRNVSEVQIDTRQLGVVMQNAYNDLCMLANEQFMENLVEDVQDAGREDTKIEAVQSSKDEKMAQTIPLITQTLLLGLQVLESQFEIVDTTRLGSISHNFGDNDHDSKTFPSMGDFSNEPIYQPKDPYEQRHLPHFIGSSDFINDDTLGIGYIDDMEEAQEKSQDSGSVASLPSDRRDYLTSSSSDSEEDLPSKASKVVFNDNVSQHSDDLFESKSITKTQDLMKSDTEPSSVTAQPNKPLSLTDQLNKQLKARLSVSVKPSDNISDKMEESCHDSDDQKIKTKAQGSHSGSDEYEEDIFTTTNNKVLTPQKTPRSSLASSTNKGVESKVEKVRSEGSKKTPEIFEDHTDSDEDMFKPSKTVTVTKQKEVPVVKERKVSEGFTDTDDDLFKPTKAVASTKKEVPTTTRTIPSKGLPEEFPGTHSNSVKSNKVEASTKRKVVPVLEEDSDSDDMFLPKKSETNIKKKPVSPAISHKKNSEKTDDDDDFFDLLSPKTKSTSIKESKSTKEVTLPKSSKEVTPPKSSKEVTPPKSSKEVPEVKKSLPLVKPFNFSSDDDDIDDLFNIPAKKSQTLMTVKINNPPRVEEVPRNVPDVVQTRSSESSDDNSLFGSSPSKKVNNEKKEVKEDIVSKINNNNKLSGPFYDPLVENNSPKVEEPQRNISPMSAKQSPLVSNSKKQSDFESPQDERKDDPRNEDVPKSSTMSRNTDFVKEVPESTINIPSKDMRPDLSSDDDDIFKESEKKQSKNNKKTELKKDSPEIVPAPRKSLPGARPVFGAGFQISSLKDELEKRNRKKEIPSDIEEDIKEDNVVKLSSGHIVDDGRVMSSNSVWPTKTVTREESPGTQDEVAINLEAPAKIVNQLTFLNKGKPKKPSNKKVNIIKKEVSSQEIISEVTVATMSEVATDVLPKPLNHEKEAAATLKDDDSDIFSNLPPPEKKAKSKKKEASRTKVTPQHKVVDIDDIDDIFAVPSGKSSSKKKSKSKNVTVITKDPLGAT